MHSVLAAAPLVVACVLLAVGVGAVRAAVVSIACAALIAVLAFPVPVTRAWSSRSW
jgi:L-lactate permease